VRTEIFPAPEKNRLCRRTYSGGAGQVGLHLLLADGPQTDQFSDETMNEYETSDEHRPVIWLRGYPVYAAHFIVLVFVASMLVTTLLNLFGVGQLLNGLVFSSGQVLRGEVWRVVTYGLRNEPSLAFVIDMAMIVWFGREVERHFGRRTFLVFYGVLYLLTPLLFTVIGVWVPMALAGESGAFAVFIAFATLYPNAPVFFNLLAKWVALVLVGIYTLIALNNRDLVSLISLWATTGFAFAFVRYQQGMITLPKPNLFRSGPKLRVLPDLKSDKTTGVKTKQASTMAEVDALLDKIALSGIASLTSKERAKLDAARADLLKRESGRH
jgi:membrane associated rhomboid family serine protease